MVMLRVGHAGEAEVTDLEVAGGVQQQVAGLQISVEDVGGVDVLEAAQYLIEKIADVVIAQPLGLEQLVEIRLHETLDDVDVLHGVHGGRPQDVSDVNNVFMIEPGQYLDLPQGSLTVSLVFKRTDLLNCNL